MNHNRINYEKRATAAYVECRRPKYLDNPAGHARARLSKGASLRHNTLSFICVKSSELTRDRGNEVCSSTCAKAACISRRLQDALVNTERDFAAARRNGWPDLKAAGSEHVTFMSPCVILLILICVRTSVMAQDCERMLIRPIRAIVY